MRSTTLFNKLIRLQGAWVKDVTFEVERVVVHVRPKARRHRCPVCGYASRGGYDWHERDWRHIALGAWQVVIRARVLRVRCPKHGILHEAVAWAAQESQFTLDFEELVAWLAREMNITAVTRLVKIAWATVSNIIQRVVGRKLDEERLNDLFEIGIDEVSYRKGHKYLTVVVNHRTGKPVWIGKGRSKDTLEQFFKELGPEKAAKLRVVTLDMGEPFIAKVRERAPQAEIAFDPFHVVKLGSEAVHEVRRAEAHEHKGTPEGATLKGSRWALLKAAENLRPEERFRLSEVAKMNAPVYRAYLLKEELRMLYRCGPRVARRHLVAWRAWAARSRLKPFVRLGKTLGRHAEGVLASIRLGVSNARLEGVNNKIGVIKRRAYGFHSANALMAMIFLCIGDLRLQLPI